MSQQIYTKDLNVTAFTCGCLWRWWTGEVGPQNHRWEKQCAAHAAQSRPAECTCLDIGQDNGATTCWQHHDCMDGSCTHME